VLGATVVVVEVGATVVVVEVGATVVVVVLGATVVVVEVGATVVVEVVVVVVGTTSPTSKRMTRASQEPTVAYPSYVPVICAPT
jgi:hypothetical protein